MAEIIRYSNMRGVGLEEVIRLEINEGYGTDEDPVRRVIYWYTKDGYLIGHTDNYNVQLRFGEEKTPQPTN